jgi:hypothetical protein
MPVATWSAHAPKVTFWLRPDRAWMVQMASSTRQKAPGYRCSTKTGVRAIRQLSDMPIIGSVARQQAKTATFVVLGKKAHWKMRAAPTRQGQEQVVQVLLVADYPAPWLQLVMTTAQAHDMLERLIADYNHYFGVPPADA